MTDATFRAKAPGIMRRLMQVFSIEVDDAAAIMGNLGHESAGFTKLQEIKPTVKGSRGGYGWAQWTGPRRKAFEAWCKSAGLAPSSDEANLGYLIVELKGEYHPAIAKTKAAGGLLAKVKAFELAFERAGVKHYPERLKWAEKALDAWRGADAPKPAPKPKASPRPPVAGGEVKKSDAILHLGSTGPFVVELQQKLNALGYAVAVSGSFREPTETAVKRFQKAAGFTGDDIDGWAGPRTLDALGQALKAMETQPKLDAAAEVVNDAAADGKTVSKTEIAAGITMASGTAAAAKEVVDSVHSTADSLMSIAVTVGPWALAVIAVVGAAGFIIYERRKRRLAATAAQKVMAA